MTDKILPRQQGRKPSNTRPPTAVDRHLSNTGQTSVEYGFAGNGLTITIGVSLRMATRKGLLLHHSSGVFALSFE